MKRSEKPSKSGRYSGSSDHGDEIREKLLAQPFMPVGKLLMSYRNVFLEMGLVQPAKQALGTGSFGVAYEVEIECVASVLKITRDPYEVLSSYALAGEETKRTVPIYNVWSCVKSVPKGKKGHNWLGWFVVHRGLLEPLSKTDAQCVDVLHDLYFDSGLDLRIPSEGKAGSRERDRWRGAISEMLPPKMAQRAVQLFGQICEGVREMRKVGIEWSDFHSDNIMRDEKGGLRIADVGFGIPQYDEEIEPPDFTLPDVREYLEALSLARRG